MKRIILLASALLLCISALAQEETPSKFSLYGFIRNYAVFDSRVSKAGTQDLYFYMPEGEKLSTDNTDLNATPSFRMLSLTTRLGLKVSGYQFGSMKVNGAVEADFYCMSGSVAVFRMRQAYVGLGWDLAENSNLLVNIGQTWHPLAADMPHITNLETGAPFNPFNRSPQVMAHYSPNEHFTLTGGILFPMQYLPTGPEGKSLNYNKYAMIPEGYFGVAYKAGGFIGKVGVDVLTIKPYYNYTVSENVPYKDGDGANIHAGNKTLTETVTTTRGKANGLLTNISPFIYLQYTKGKFQIKAKSVLAQGGEHMNLLSGYGVYRFEESTHTYTYTPMRDWASFVSFQYGKKVQVLGMLGYMKQLGTTADLGGALWMNTAAATNIHEAFRATPTVAWNIGKLTLSLEYNLTAAHFGEGNRNARGLYDNQGKWIMNHRIIWMTKFNF